MAWVFDTAHTSIEFSAKHMMISTVRGRFNTFTGTLNIDEAHPEKSSVEVVIDTASVDTREPNRDGHLRAADFFDVEKYPAMTFKSKRIEGSPLEGDFKFVGDLTVKDVTREVVLKVSHEGQGKDPWGNQHYGFVAETSFNRKDFGLVWNMALETGGVLVGDQIKVHIDTELIKKEEPVAEATATK